MLISYGLEIICLRIMGWMVMGLCQTYVVQIQTVKFGFYYITLLKRRVMAIKIEDSLQTQEPFKLTIFGDNGTGKSSLMEKHGLFYNYEDGLRYLNCKQVRLVGEPLEATTEASQYIYKNAKELLQQHSCLVIDSLDFLEKRLKTGNKLRLRKWQKPHPSIVLSKFFWMPV